MSVLGFSVQAQENLVSKAGHVQFYSHTDVEDITANNYKMVSKLTPSTGAVVFSLPMQSFEFEIPLMQKHYNSSKFLDTKKFPKAKFVGKISNLDQINFGTDGTYDAVVKGDLTLHGVTKAIEEKGTVTIAAGIVKIDAKMIIKLEDYEVAFEKGKPSTNIAKEIEVTIKAEHATQG